MPTIRDKLYFNFDGRWSSEFGIISVVLDNSMFEDVLVSSREVSVSRVSGSRKSNLQSIEDQPLEFELNLAFESKFDNGKIDDIIRWLFVDYYRPLYFEEADGRIYYCMPDGESKITHNGLSEGYITINMKCISSSLYSPIIASSVYNVGNDTKTVSIFNDGHFTVYPEISIEKIGNGKVTITSVNDGGKIFEVLNLTDTEGIYIDSDREIIESDIVGVNRYDDVLGEYPRLKYGKNNFNISGNCIIQFRYRNEYRF